MKFDQAKLADSKRRKYSSPKITHQDSFARTSLAGCATTGGDFLCAACVNSSGSDPSQNCA